MSRLDVLRYILATHALAMVLLAGCQAQPAATPEPVDPVNPSTREHGDGINAAQLMPLEEWEGTYHALDGFDTGQSFEASWRKHDGGWRFEMTGDGTMWLKELGTQGLGLIREANDLEGVMVTYDPPIGLMPSLINSGEVSELTGRSKVLVTSTKTGERRAGGYVDWEVQAIWQPETPTLKGVVPWVIRQHRIMKLDLAEVDITIDTTWHSGVGITTQSTWRTQNIGFIRTHRHTNRTLQSLP